MKKIIFFLAATVCILFTSNLMAQPCDTLKTEVIITYHQALQLLPAKLCVDITWEFDNGVKCPQQLSVDKGSSDAVAGAFLVRVNLPVGDCPPAPPCLTEENVKSITVFVYDCEDTGAFNVEKKVEGYQNPISVNFW